MKKYKGLTKPIKKKLDNITRLYNFYSEFYIMANEYIDIYRDICKQIQCVEDVFRKCC